LCVLIEVADAASFFAYSKRVKIGSVWFNERSYIRLTNYFCLLPPKEIYILTERSNYCIIIHMFGKK
jgi:hypothetical protein